MPLWGAGRGGLLRDRGRRGRRGSDLAVDLVPGLIRVRDRLRPVHVRDDVVALQRLDRDEQGGQGPE